LDVGCIVGAEVAGANVGDTRVCAGAIVPGIWVNVPDTGSVVFVGKGAGLVGGATVTVRSHARATKMIMERNKNIFLIVAFPFSLDHSPQRQKTPPPVEEFGTGQVDSPV
jgi:hypothetical protein